VKIFEARDLPVMDRKTKLTDAFVEVQFGDKSEKTDIIKHSLNPSFNKSFRFDVSDDKVLQDLPLRIIIWDYDVVSSNDIIGTIYIDLTSLVNSSVPIISGWYPIFDTISGLRGELKIKIRLEFFGNVNTFADSSAGVRFFNVSAPLSCYSIEAVYGFVGELITKGDPEYHWTDSFRAARITNSARQYLLYELSGTLKRQIGKKAKDIGANAVLGYCSQFDTTQKEIVARGYGTAVKLKQYSLTDVELEKIKGKEREKHEDKKKKDKVEDKKKDIEGKKKDKEKKDKDEKKNNI